jgi:two-component system, chemotaxis family, protein-glutamate methylesterase/glutaminase
MKRIRILIVDESVICRDALSRALSGVDDVEVLAAAPTGKIGIERLRQRETDILVLSSTIRDPDAATVTSEALQSRPNLGVLLITSDQPSDAEMVVKALGAGAFDFAAKPRSDATGEIGDVLKRRLLPKIRAFSAALYSRMAQRISAGQGARAEGAAAAEPSDARAIQAFLKDRAQRVRQRLRAVVIGISTGGPEALKRVVPALPDSFPLPIAIVVHMPEPFTSSLAKNLHESSKLTVAEAVDGDDLAAGRVYVAPGGRHLAFEGATRNRILARINEDPPENGCRPSVDVMFTSAAKACPNGILAVIMTGMGDDGVKGLRALKAAGAYVLAQDEATSVVWGMPGSAVRAGLVDEVLPLGSIADRLLKLAGSP